LTHPGVGDRPRGSPVPLFPEPLDLGGHLILLVDQLVDAAEVEVLEVPLHGQILPPSLAAVHRCVP
jgi:hypothetical protein